MRTLSLVSSILLLLLLVGACGDDDDSGETATPPGSPQATEPRTATAAPTVTAVASPSPAGTEAPTFDVVVTPSRTRPPDADRVGLGLLNALDHFQQNIGNAAPVSVPCEYEEEDAIIDCTSEGFGRIALDPIPTGGGNWRCNALLDLEGDIFAANCISTTDPATFIYKVE